MMTFLSPPVLSQVSPDVPKFQTTDIYPSAPNMIRAMRSGFYDGRYELRNATVADLIRTAWNLGGENDEENVVSGPEWLYKDRFDVIATAPVSSSDETLRAMLRALLADRFHLKLHTGTRDRLAYAMVPVKEHHLKAAVNLEETGCQLQSSPNPASRRGPPEPIAFVCHNMTMAAFANQLPTLPGARDYLFNYRVADQTGLNGAWDFSIRWSMPNPNAPGQAAGQTITLFDAFENLGLQLKLTKVPLPVVIVDGANLPEAAGTPAELPVEFEVSTIKPAGPGTRGGNVGTEPNGQVHLDMTLKNLIQEAWGDITPARIVGAPASDETVWVVVAKPPPTRLAGYGVMNGFDLNTMRMMLRALLRDRFKLETHEEQRLVDGYQLVAAKPKLRKADPSNHPGCNEGLGPDATKSNWKDPRIKNPRASRLVTCWNMTLPEFAAALSNWKVDENPILFDFPPVMDATKIAGKYDLTINFSPPSPEQRRELHGGPPARNPVASSDPDGTISIFEALDKQLGLKLKPGKVMAPVLVIDHVEDKPTEN